MLKDQILKTVKYFDVQDHCLTLLEIHKYLLAPQGNEGYAPKVGENSAAQIYSLYEILNCLESQLAAEISSASGFYFLRGREILVPRRTQNNAYATPRLKRAEKFLRYTRHIPFIAAVALTGSEALNNSKQGSDIDLLVLTKSGRMWLGRLFITMYFHVFGVRRHGNLVADRFCLNHYIEQGKKIAADRNIYTAVEYVSLVPYFGTAEVYNFQQLNMDWIKKYLAQPSVIKYPEMLSASGASRTQKFLETVFANPVGDGLNKLVGNLQRRRIKLMQNIVVSSDELAFHPGSKGKQVLAKAGLEE